MEPSSKPPSDKSDHHAEKKIFPLEVVFGFLLLVVLLGLGAYFFTGTSSTTSPVACTAEAKICPDGTTVQRGGLSCEFAACPTVVDVNESVSDGVVHADTAFGYTLKYPKSWSIDNVRSTKSELVFTVPNSDGRESLRVEQSFTSLDQWTRGFRQADVVTTTDLTVAGQAAKRVDTKDGRTSIGVKNGKWLYVFSTTDGRMVKNGLVTSVNFGVVGLDVTSNWRTYSDKTTGVSFKYPGTVKVETSQPNIWNFCNKGVCYEVSLVDLPADRAAYWRDQSTNGPLKFNFQEYVKEGNTVFRAPEYAFDVILTPQYEIHVIRHGPEGAGVAPTKAKDEWFAGLESTVSLNGKVLL